MSAIQDLLCMSAMGFLLVGVTACGTDAATQPPGARVAETYVVSAGGAHATPALIGELRAANRSDLAFELPGLVTKVNVRLDDAFQAGDILAQLDPRMLDQASRASRSALSGAQARRTEAQLHFERIRDLSASGAVSQSELDAAQARLDSTDSEERSLEAEHSRVLEQLRQTELRAPFSGRITARLIEPGQVVQPGQLAFMVADVDGTLEVRVDVPLRRLASFRPGNGAKVVMNGEAMQRRAEVIEVSRAVNREGLVPVVIQVIDVEELKPGARVTVHTLASSAESWLAIPLTALLAEADNRAAVWLLDADNRTVLQPIEIGSIDAEQVWVRAGLQEGQRIVARGARLLRESETIVPANGELQRFNP